MTTAEALNLLDWLESPGRCARAGRGEGGQGHLGGCTGVGGASVGTRTHHETAGPIKRIIL